MPPAPRCASCDKLFASQIDLKMHRLNVHQEYRDQNRSPSPSYNCLEGCEITYKTCAELRSHLKDVHNQTHEVELLRFATNEEFTMWLRSTQDNIPRKYVLSRGIARTKTSEKTYLHCHQPFMSGKSKSIENTQTAINNDPLNIERSSLKNSACTSQIVIEENLKDGTYLVEYHRNHYGHPTNVDPIVSKLKPSISPGSQTTSEHVKRRPARRSSKLKRKVEQSKSYGSHLKCNICNKEFYYKKNVYAHMRNIHKMELISKKEPKLCDHCGETFVRKFDFRQHMQKFHKAATQRKCRVVCSYKDCEEPFLTYALLRGHLFHIHGIEIQFEEITFDSKNEFEEWKTKIEQETFSFYTKSTGIIKQNVKQGTHTQMYDCHRSYMYERRGKAKRATKSMGSNKINKACPSRLEVTFSASQVYVIFWKTHCGHSTEIERTYLDVDTKAQIGVQLVQGIPYRKIIDNLLKDSTKRDGFQRLHLVRRQDIYNILRTKIEKIKKSHLQSATIDVNAIEELSESQWTVPSTTNMDRFLVQRDEQVSCTNCLLKCTECKMCIHTYTCSCSDYAEALNICEHIHACAARLLNNNLNENVDNASVNSVEELNRAAADVSDEECNETASTDIKLLEQKLELAIGLCKNNYTFNSENITTMHKHADTLIEMLNNKTFEL